MSMAMKYAMKKRAEKTGAGCMAEGGMVDDVMPKEDEDDGSDGIVDRIMKRFSKGGMVANDTPPVADEEENDFDVLATDDGLESSYTGADSGDELGNEQEDEDRRDVVSRIMRSRGKKDRMPRPA